MIDSWNQSFLIYDFGIPAEARCKVENEDVVGPLPANTASTKSEWSNNCIAYLGASYIRGLAVYIYI